MAEADFTLYGLVTDDYAAFVPAGTFRAFEMPDDSMYPRLLKGELAILESGDSRCAQVGDDVLVQLPDGRWQARMLAGYTNTTITLSAYSLPTEVTIARSEITKLYPIDLIVPADRLALMTSDGVTVRDAMLRHPVYDDFCNPEVILTSYDDQRLGMVSDDPCWSEKAWNGPTYVVIRPTATDEQLSKVAARFHFEMDALKDFRAHHAK